VNVVELRCLRMVFLVVDPAAVPEAMALAKQLGCAIWVGSDGVTEDEYQRGRDEPRRILPNAAIS
jgi:hypothetical protein